MHLKRGSLKKRFALFNSIIVLFVIILSLSGTLYIMNKASKNTLTGDKLEQLKAFEQHYNWDTYERFLKNQREDNDYFSLCEEFNDYREKSNLLYFYTLKIEKNGEISYLIDGLSKSDSPSPIGEKSKIPQEYKHEFLSKKPFVTDMYSDPTYGKLFSIYTPIINKSGEFLGYVGMDLKASVVQKVISDNIKSSILIITIVTTFILSIVVLANIFYSNRALRPLEQLEIKATHMALGDLTVITNQKIEIHDEISSLEHNFQLMGVNMKNIISDSYKLSSFILNRFNILCNNAYGLQKDTTDLTAASEEIATANNEVGFAIEGISSVVSNFNHEISLVKTQIENLRDAAENISTASTDNIAVLSSLINQNKETNADFNNFVISMNALQESTNTIKQTLGQLEQHTQSTKYVYEINETMNNSVTKSLEAIQSTSHSLQQQGFIIENIIKQLYETNNKTVTATNSICTLNSTFDHLLLEQNKIMTEVVSVNTVTEETIAATEEVNATILQINDNTNSFLKEINEIKIQLYNLEVQMNIFKL